MPFTMQDNDFMVIVGPNGHFGKSEEYSSRKEIDHMIQSIHASGRQSVSLHFHGGLVSRSRGMEAARELAPKLDAAGTYPLCFIWETGLLETLRDRLLTIHESPFFKKMMLKALKKFAERYVPAIASRGSRNNISDAWIREEMSKEKPFAEWNEQTVLESSRSMLSDREYERGEKAVTDEIERELEEELDRDGEMADLIREDEALHPAARSGRGLLTLTGTIRKLAKIVWRVIKRFYQDRDHGFHATVTEEVLREFYIGEIGSEIWDVMKTKAERMWDGNRPEDEETSQHVASYVLDKLIATFGNTDGFRLNLIAHSAGSIAILNGYKALLQRKHGPLLKEMIFIAPACRIDLAIDAVGKNTPVHGRWSQFALSEERELADVLVPVVYPHSLLYFVSGLLENGGEAYDEYILGMQRFWKDHPVFKDDAHIGQIRNMFNGSPHWPCFSPDYTGGIPGRMTNGTRHSEIDNELYTLQSIQHLILN